MLLYTTTHGLGSAFVLPTNDRFSILLAKETVVISVVGMIWRVCILTRKVAKKSGTMKAVHKSSIGTLLVLGGAVAVMLRIM